MNKQKFIAAAIAGVIVYIAASGKVKNPAVSTFMIGVGGIVALRQLPFVGDYV